MTTRLAAMGLLSAFLVARVAEAASVTASDSELAAARQWAAARFEGRTPATSSEPALVVLANHGPVQKNARGAKPLRLGDREYTRGLYCHAPSKLIVRLPGLGEVFTAVVGVDSNDQTSGGRGSVEFSIHVGGAERFRSGVMREGAPSRAVKVELGGATEFVLQVEETPDGIACDQADWAEAKVTVRDGRDVWLADLPLGEEGTSRLFSTEPPFSFSYGGKPSADLLKEWKLERRKGPTEGRQPRSHERGYELLWTDPSTGLQVRCAAVEYSDFPTVEWTLHFKNTGTADTPVLSDIQALDVSLDRPDGGEFVLHHNKGDDNTPDSYEPLQLGLGPTSEHRFAAVGGRPTQRAFPYFNIEWPGAGLIAVIGWPGQWAAQFTRDGARGLRVRAGQELTRFKLHPSEEVRSPLIVLQFWKDDRVRAQNIWRRWMLAHNLPRTRDGHPPPRRSSPRAAAASSPASSATRLTNSVSSTPSPKPASNSTIGGWTPAGIRAATAGRTSGPGRPTRRAFRAA